MTNQWQQLHAVDERGVSVSRSFFSFCSAHHLLLLFFPSPGASRCACSAGVRDVALGKADDGQSRGGSEAPEGEEGVSACC